MQRMFISEVRDELRGLHSSPRPWNDTLGIHIKDSGNQSPHSLLFGIEAKKEILMFHGLEGRFTFFKATGHWHWVALKERLKMPVHLHRDTSDMCGDLMDGPSVT